jgi:outer membrane autotransporter protein
MSRQTNCRNLWGLAYGTGGKTDHDGSPLDQFGHGYNGYDQSFFGTIVGLDRLYGQSTRAGIYAAYGEGRISNSMDESDSKELLIGLYLRREMKVGYMLLNGGLGYNQYDTTRTLLAVPNPISNRGKHSGFVGTLYGERGLEFQGAIFKWQPFLGLQFIGNQLESFSENGPAATIDGDITTIGSFRSLFGTRFSTDLARSHRGSLSLFGQAVWMHEMLDSTHTDFSGQITGQKAIYNITATGNDAGRDWAIVGTGLTYDTRCWRLFAGYDITLNDQQVLHTGNAGLTYGW